MPLYDFACRSCGAFFERVAGHLDRWVVCDCGSDAERRPYSGIPNLKGETVSRAIPDPAYRTEAQKRELTQSWGDASKAVELLRKHSHVDASGERVIDVKGMNSA